MSLKDANARWVDVADGYFHEFLDEDLRPGVDYEYRVAGWNVIGRSPYAQAVFAADARLVCEPLDYLGAFAFAPLARAARSLWYLIQLLLSSLVLVSALLRLRNGASSSSASPHEYHPIFAKTWACCRAVLSVTPV